MELRNKYDTEISFDNLAEAKSYFLPKEEIPCEPEKFSGENYESFCTAFKAYKTEIKAANNLEELADVLNRYSDEFGNGSEYYTKETYPTKEFEIIQEARRYSDSMISETDGYIVEHEAELYFIHKNKDFDIYSDDIWSWSCDIERKFCFDEIDEAFYSYYDSKDKKISLENIKSLYRKYELTDIRQSVSISGETLYKIKALKDFTNEATGTEIKAGQLGGYVESEKNLSQSGTCWVDENARVFNNATVSDDAYIGGEAMANKNVNIKDSAIVSGGAWLTQSAKISGNAYIRDMAFIKGEAEIGGTAEVAGHHTIGGDTVLTSGIHDGTAAPTVTPTMTNSPKMEM